MIWLPLVLAVTTVQATQDPPAPASSVLSASDVKALNKDVKEWFEAWQKYEFEATSSSDRRKHGRATDKAREKFEKEWAAKSKKVNPLASPADLRAVFENAFSYERTNPSGNLKLVKDTPETPGYSFVAPRTYDPRNAYVGVLLLPGFDDAKAAWEDPQSYYDNTWKDSPIADQSIVVIPRLDNGMQLDSLPDDTKPGAEEDEIQRLRAVLAPFGQVQREYNLARDRLILDCGRGSSGFGVRLATYFPSRFAGLIVRWPTELEGLRLGSLTGLPILIVANEQTQAAADSIKKRIDAHGGNKCTILAATTNHPYGGESGRIGEWANTVRRDLTPSRVVIELTSDRFKNGYWVQIGTAEPLNSVSKDQRPSLTVVADRATNRITVTAVNVSDYRLLLNDDLIDLGQPFTVVTNGVAVQEQRERNMDWMIRQMQTQFDPTYVFTSWFDGTVPKTP